MQTELAQMAHTTTTLAATSITIATIIGWLPNIAAGFAVIWYIILIIEKRSGKPMVKWFRKDKK